jgi:hypothetical protein
VRSWLFVLALAGTARADVPIAAQASLGVGTAASHNAAGYGDREFAPIAPLQLDVGFRIRDDVMIGLHVGTATPSTRRELDVRTMFDTEYVYDYLPIQAGITAHAELAGSFVVGGWLGIERGWQQLDCLTITYKAMGDKPPDIYCGGSWESVAGTSPAFGATVGRDVLVRDDHRVAVAASLTYALETGGRYFSHASASVVIAYRWWAP